MNEAFSRVRKFNTVLFSFYTFFLKSRLLHSQDLSIPLFCHFRFRFRVDFSCDACAWFRRRCTEDNVRCDLTLANKNPKVEREPRHTVRIP